MRALGGQIKALCGAAGADVVYDAVGGDYAEPALRATGWFGRYLVIGFPAGVRKSRSIFRCSRTAISLAYTGEPGSGASPWPIATALQHLSD